MISLSAQRARMSAQPRSDKDSRTRLLEFLQTSEVPVLLDLFCGAGGAAYGYWQAGWMVVGVDNLRQRHYPFPFYQADALDFLEWTGDVFDAYHASPPCQAFSRTKRRVARRLRRHVNLIDVVRDEFQALSPDRLWVIENVEDAPLRDPTVLCGTMFDIPSYRHRLFESNVPLTAPAHPKHVAKSADLGRTAKPGQFYQWIGSCPDVSAARLHMGVHWMSSREVSQVVPPAYTAFIGSQLLAYYARRL